MDKRDEKALRQIGQVDLDKVGSHYDNRQQNILEVMNDLEEKADAEELSDWEYDFYESIQKQLARGMTLSDSQYEKLLQIQVKYE